LAFIVGTTGLEELGQLAKLIAGFGVEHSLADQDDRTPGLGERPHGRHHLSRIGHGQIRLPSAMLTSVRSVRVRLGRMPSEAHASIKALLG